MKYKIYALLLLVTTLALLSACGGPRLLNTNGDSLTFPRSNPAVSIDKTWVNNSPYPFFVGPEGDPRMQVNPGHQYTFHRKSDREETWVLIWPMKVGINERLTETEFVRTGVFPGDIIYIDEAFLRGLVYVEIVIENDAVESIDFLVQGVAGTAPARDAVIINVIPGPMDITWLPSRRIPRQTQAMKFDFTVPATRQTVWRGKFYAWGIKIAVAHPYGDYEPR